jgi:hypothetical protein
MISNFVSNTLLTERGNRWITQLDDSTSMTSIAIRDGLDTSGRTLMEYKRSKHGGRERLIEEVATLLIWGFGIRFLKERVYDPLVRKFTRVKHPDLDMTLLENGPQKLTPELVEKFNNHASFNGAYTELLKVVKDEGGLQKLQGRSTNAKFLLATGIPVLLIAFGIPTFNQWLTRRKLEQEGKLNQGNFPPVSQNQPSATPLFMPNVQAPNAFSGFQAQAPQGRSVPGSAFLSGNPAASMPSANSNPAQAQGSLPTQPHFSGLGGLVSMLLQNERYHTLLVDATISGGRTAKARNWTERREIMFREALVIFFLYFAQAPIQRFFSNLFDKRPGIHTQLQFDTMKHLYQVYGKKTSQFQTDYRKSMAQMVQLLGIPEQELFRKTRELEAIQNFRWVKRLINPQKVARLEAMEAELETKLVKAVHSYFLEDKSGDLFFETAKSCGWIPTFKKDGKQMLSLTQKISTQPILRMAEAYSKIHDDLSKLLLKAAPAEAENLFGKIIRKSITGRTGAMVLANGVCFLLLSILAPMVQHKITKRITGKDYFPGVSADQDQKARLLNMA